MGWTLILAIVLALAAFGVWRWAVAAGSAGTLDWIDARFSRERAAQMVLQGRYGPDEAQRVEIWTPTGHDFAEPAPPPGETAPPHRYPLMVFIHGGGWHSGSPEDYRFVARTLADRGYATALVGYRLVPGGRWPAMLEDSAAAVRWVRDNAAKAGVAADNMILTGHSAGAYNVLMLGLDPQWLGAAGVPESSIAGVVSLAGPADFYPWTSDSAVNALGNAQDPQATQPVNFARADAPPILLLHGTADDVVRPKNSAALARALKAAGGRVQVEEFEGMGHAGIIMALSKPFAQDGKVLDPMLAFMRQPAAAPSVPVQGENR